MKKILSPDRRRFIRVSVAAGLLAAVVSMSTGCTVLKFFAWAIGGDPNKNIKVLPQYTRMENKSFAVLVAADEYIMFQYPDAAASICNEVSTILTDGVPGVRPMDPKQVIAFQNENPHWNTARYSDLIRRLKVDRLIVIDMRDYALHEPGSGEVWQGKMSANVSIHEAEAPDLSNVAFGTSVSAAFPPNATVGVTDSNDKVIRTGLVKTFAFNVLNLFREHTETLP